MGVCDRVQRQRQLLQRIEQLVRLIRRDLCYRGSKDTADLGGAVHERLLRSPSLADKFENEPEELRGLLRTVVRHVVIDEIRRRAGLRRTRPDEAQLRLEWEARFSGPGGDLQDVLTERQRDVQRVLEELELFRLGRDGRRIAPARRERMVRALTMSWEGYSHAEIAKALGMPKATVGHNINALVVILAGRVSQSSLEPEDGQLPAPLMVAAT